MEEQYRKEIAWWFAELGSDSEVDNYLALFPELRPHPTKNVKARAVYFRGNFVYLGGSNASIVTGEMDEIHRKDTGQRILLYRI